MTSAVVSPPSVSSPAPSAAPSAAPAPAPVAKSAPVAPKAASQPPAAPSKPPVVAKDPRLPRTKRDPNAPDAMRDAVNRAAAMPDPNAEKEPTAPASTVPVEKPAVNPQDKARAALSTTGSTPEPKAPIPQPEAQRQPAQDPMAELESLRRSNSDYGRKFKSLENELSDHRKFREEQTKAAEQAKLQPYEARHPAYQQNMARIAKVESFEAAFSSLPPEQQTAQIRNGMAHRMGVNNDDLQMSTNWKAHKEQVTQQMAADPDGFVSQRAEQIAQQTVERVLNQRMQEQQIRTQVHQHLSDPIVKNFAQEHPEDFRAALQHFDNNTEAVANQVHMLHNLRKAEAERDALAKQLEEANAQRGMVTEQQRLLKGKVTLTREPAGSQPVGDPLLAARAWAKANNIPATITNAKFFAKLRELQAQNGKPQNA